MSGPPSSVRFREPLEYPGVRVARGVGGEEYRDTGVKARGFASQTGKPAAYPRQGLSWGGGRRNGPDGRLPMPAGVSEKKKKGNAKKTRQVFLMMVTALGFSISVYLFSSCSSCHRSPSGTSDSSKQHQGFDFRRKEDNSDPAEKSGTPLLPGHRSPPRKHEWDSLHAGTSEGAAKNDIQQETEAEDTIDTDSTEAGKRSHLTEDPRLGLAADHLQSEKISTTGSGLKDENSASEDREATELDQTESESKDVESRTDDTPKSDDGKLEDKKPGSDSDDTGETDPGAEQVADPLNDRTDGLSGDIPASGSVESEPQSGEKQEQGAGELDPGTDVISGVEGHQASTRGQSENKTDGKGILSTDTSNAEADPVSNSEQASAEVETTERKEVEVNLGTEVHNAEPGLEPDGQPNSERDGTQKTDEEDPKLGTDALKAGTAELSNAPAGDATEGETKEVEDVAATLQDVTSDHLTASEQGTSEQLGSVEGLSATVGGEEQDVNTGLGTDESTDLDGKQGTPEIEASVHEVAQPETNAEEPSSEDPGGIKLDVVSKDDGLYPEQVLTGAQILQQPFAKRIVVSANANLIYCPVPAAASTNWKYLIRKFEGFEDYRDLSILHDRTKSGLRFLDEFSAVQIDSMLRDQKFVTFTFVRHPMHRLLSTYINKFAKKDVTSEDYKVFIRQLYGWSETSRKDPSKLERPAFEDFVRMALEQKDVIENDHWASQQVLCGLGSFPYNFIGKLENREEDSRKLLDMIGRPEDRFPDQEELKFPINSVDKLLPNFFTTELRNATATELAQDFELLKYSTDL